MLITGRVDYIESTEKYRIDVCIAKIEEIDHNAFRVYPFCLIILLVEHFGNILIHSLFGTWINNQFLAGSFVQSLTLLKEFRWKWEVLITERYF